ncbi:CCA tRNA nucleotidyltransferase [Pyrococcus horikoshii]|uniref:CCA-adding enzyme n=2 Tax=Pyrococcus horikoshii TaxID=53953 RepID=CCA_PYRHO|nr:CCA tRNA nucleotidyltransferase [Pyrococcus horikoshii]O74081.2 RecName: Full=CCA-adding enzyme; AltName: Full=CCA tRNA nucleotidyltransferase; AltName: Full=tRNA CCA-pyrophosphorylase; AltName: Full=tRNA adenylyl-/cytidylyl- transferase; AltName: Full=tRNA nucleotidyltransferase; AltName: Full=tRNA-NT [Pyrococcus horikoshii OT3]HII61542.1 CCA tRNA nucleotidyltransferase [Pyrococcus horikoshii]
MDIEDVIAEVLQRIVPTKEEENFVSTLMEEIKEKTEETIEELNLDAKPYFVGSLAKDTYLAGDHDVDLFIAFPLDTSLEELREKGLELGKVLGERLGKYEIAYAEHPYVRAEYKGIRVDIVPCYNVKNWKDVRTAVDRSILHTHWVLENIKGKNNEVRLLKRFLKGINAYGSEIYIRGFSGYLAEILIIEFGSFLNVLEKSDFMLRKKIIDPEDWMKRESEITMKTIKREVGEDKPLIVIDPVDPRRNVAANLSWERYGLFYFKSQEFLKEPSTEFFFPRKKIGNYLSALRSRKTHLITLTFNPPKLVDDILLPQVERTAKGIKRQLELEGFKVLGYDYGREFIFLEVDRLEREGIKVKRGPLYFTQHGKRFYEKNDIVWIEGKELASEKPISTFIVDVLEEILRKGQFSAGKNIKDAIVKGDILVDFVPKELSKDAYLFLSREKFRVK